MGSVQGEAALHVNTHTRTSENWVDEQSVLLTPLKAE